MDIVINSTADKSVVTALRLRGHCPSATLWGREVEVQGPRSRSAASTTSAPPLRSPPLGGETGGAVSVFPRKIMRAGEELVPMTPDMLKRIFAEDKEDWFFHPICVDVTSNEVIELLDTETYFKLLNIPYPENQEAILERLQSDRLLQQTFKGWTIPNLSAILLAKDLNKISSSLARKAPRVVIYEGINKLNTLREQIGQKGYAVGFEGLVNFVYSSAPQNRFIEEVIRQEVNMFPKQALRELIANALVHQDFTTTGTSVMIEMYNDRVEISNPGIPSIQVERFIDEYRSRNEQLADLMRRFGICEEKGSGIDKVIQAHSFINYPHRILELVKLAQLQYCLLIRILLI